MTDEQRDLVRATIKEYRELQNRELVVYRLERAEAKGGAHKVLVAPRSNDVELGVKIAAVQGVMHVSNVAIARDETQSPVGIDIAFAIKRLE